MKYLFVLMMLMVHVPLWCQVNPCDPTGTGNPPIPGDTTIVLPSGVMLTFNRCEFFDLRACMEINDLADTVQLARRAINMDDENGIPLFTCGMFYISMDSCDKTCFDVPVRVKMPVNFPSCSNLSPDRINAFRLSGNSWAALPEDETKLLQENGRTYLSFMMKCPGGYNCDAPKKFRGKTKFRAPKGYYISNLSVSSTCPLYRKEINNDKKQRKIKIKVLCANDSNTSVKATLIGRKSQQVKITTSNILKELPHNEGKHFCNSRKNKNFLTRIFRSKVKEKHGPFLYKKYFLSLPSL